MGVLQRVAFRATAYCLPVYHPGDFFLVRVWCAVVSRPPATALFSAPSRRGAPRSRAPRARRDPLPASPYARGSPRGGVLRLCVRSRSTSPAPASRGEADADTGPRATVFPSVLASVPAHAALPSRSSGPSPRYPLPPPTAQGPGRIQRSRRGSPFGAAGYPERTGGV